MLMPLMAYGYAHFTDEVQKKYKIHVGSLYLNVTGFHVDGVKMPDLNQDGKLFHDIPEAGDELNITIYEADDCRWYVEITADPIGGGFYLNTTMNMTNGGKLPFELTWELKWDGPFDEDPCFDVAPDTALPLPDPWTWEMNVYKWNGTHWSGPWGTTQTHYKPGDVIKVEQHIGFPQLDDPTQQKLWQCKWIKIWITFCAEDLYMEDSSWTWP